MSKSLTVFNSEEEFKDYYTQRKREYPQISYIKDSKIVNYMEKPKPFPIRGVFYDKTSGNFVKLFLENIVFNANLEPIGVEIVPDHHDVYGNGKGGVISLKNMNLSDPVNGTLGNSAVCYGPNKDEPKLQNYTRVLVYTDTGFNVQNFGYLIKDGVYNYPSGHIPSPYNNDNSRNADYYDTTHSAYNALSDFKGKENTKNLVTSRGTKDYKTWVPSNTVNDYPAASLCDMYYIIGTSQGDWYLPAAGELGYLMAKWTDIQNIFAKITELYGDNICIAPSNNQSIWTSSENQAKNARYVHTDNGLGYSDKTTSYVCRAFTQI